MCFPKSDVKQKTKCQEAYKQSSGVGMHQNPHFQLKPIKNWKKLEIRVPSTIAIPESALMLYSSACAFGLGIKWLGSEDAATTQKWHSKQNKKRTLPGSLQTVVRSGDAPKHPFPIKTNQQLEKSKNQDSINHPYFWVCSSCPLAHMPLNRSSWLR